jgi:hypothetical protein
LLLKKGDIEICRCGLLAAGLSSVLAVHTALYARGWPVLQESRYLYAKSGSHIHQHTHAGV